MSDISDPGRVGRRDRKRAQKIVDAAYAAGLLTAADRTLRTQRVDSAHTKGDLAIIVRDLDRTATAAAASTAVATGTTPTTTPADPPPTQASTSLGSAIPPDQLRAMSHGRSVPTIDVREAVGSLRVANAKKVRRIILIVVVGFFLLCGLGITGIVTAIFSGISDVANPGGGGTPVSTVNLQTAKGWTELVTAIDEETGSSRVYDAVIYPEYASINAVADEGAMRYVYRGGKFDLFNSPVTPATGQPIDLADIDADLIAGLPEQTADRQKMPDFDSAYIIVNTVSGQPSIMVYVQQTGRLSRWSIYDLKGNVTGGTPDEGSVTGSSSPVSTS